MQDREVRYKFRSIPKRAGISFEWTRDFTITSGDDHIEFTVTKARQGASLDLNSGSVWDFSEPGGLEIEE